jgi:tetratricopeptide (TPR) repeat protein
VYCNRALCHLNLRLWAEALKDATSCIELNFYSVIAFYRRALAAEALGHYSFAMTDAISASRSWDPGSCGSRIDLDELLARLDAALGLEEPGNVQTLGKVQVGPGINCVNGFRTMSPKQQCAVNVTTSSTEAIYARRDGGCRQ